MTRTMILTLERCTLSHETGYQDMVREHLAQDGDYPYNNYPLALSDFAAYVREVDEEAEGIGLPEDIPAQQTLVVVLDGAQVMGEVRFRPRLVDAPPELQNGHIGYNLRPSARGKGFGTRMIGLIKLAGRGAGLSFLYATIDPQNVASIRIVEKNGGFLERVALTHDGGTTGLYKIPTEHIPNNQQ